MSFIVLLRMFCKSGFKKFFLGMWLDRAPGAADACA
jgi:hypothetical protein